MDDGKRLAGLAALGSRKWWDAAGTRALKTLAQAAIGALVVETIWDVDWKALVGFALVPALLSLLTSLAGIPEAKDGE